MLFKRGTCHEVLGYHRSVVVPEVTLLILLAWGRSTLIQQPLRIMAHMNCWLLKTKPIIDNS